MTSQYFASRDFPEGIRLKWILDALESGRRGANDPESDEGKVLSIGSEHIGWHGEWLLDDPRYISRNLFDSMSSGVIRPNDILLVKDGATIGKVAIADWMPHCEAAVNERVFLLRVSETYYARYYFYVIQSPAVQTQIWLNARGSVQPGLMSEFRNKVVVPRPSKSQQKAIADYLDRETARLDALVAAKERVLDLLAEKRRALIAHAVTRGVHPDTPLRDSGVPWLGDIPAHWEIDRARWLFVERGERSGTGDEELLTVSHINGVTSRSEKDVKTFEPATTTGHKLCIAGDLVVNTQWAWMGAMGVSPVDGIVSPAYHVYVPAPRLEPSYIDALVRLPVFAQEVMRYSKGVGSSRLRLYPEGLFEVSLPVPPLREQEEIVAQIAFKTSQLDHLQNATETSITLLKERRSALIAAAVTGQTDIGKAT